MKARVFVLVMLIVASTAFAQVTVSLTGQATTGWFVMTDGIFIWPGLGVEVGVGPVDILAEFEFGIHKERYLKGDPGQYSGSLWYLGISAGVAPKIGITDKVTVSFPFMLKLIPNGERLRYKDKRYEVGGTVKKATNLVFGIEAGARTYFAITPKWSVFTGIQAVLFSVQGQTKSTAFNGTTAKDKKTTTNIFDAGSIELGVRFTF